MKIKLRILFLNTLYFLSNRTDIDIGKEKTNLQNQTTKMWSHHQDITIFNSRVTYSRCFSKYTNIQNDKQKLI